MQMFRWRWVLPLLQILIAFAAFVYAPYQYKSRPHPIGDDTSLVGLRKAWPPPILRASYAVNFPALTVSYAVQFTDWGVIPVIRRADHPFIWLTVQNNIFLVAVGALWYRLGTMLDSHVRPLLIDSSRALHLLKSVMGCLYALAVAALAIFYVTLTNADLPLRQIGFVGLLWAAILLWYFGSNLKTALRMP